MSSENMKAHTPSECDHVDSNGNELVGYCMTCKKWFPVIPGQQENTQMSSENMKAHTPKFKQHNDITEAKQARDEKEKTRLLVQQARTLSLRADSALPNGCQSLHNAAICKLCDAIDRILDAK